MYLKISTLNVHNEAEWFANISLNFPYIAIVICWAVIFRFPIFGVVHMSCYIEGDDIYSRFELEKHTRVRENSKIFVQMIKKIHWINYLHGHIDLTQIIDHEKVQYFWLFISESETQMWHRL